MKRCKQRLSEPDSQLWKILTYAVPGTHAEGQMCEGLDVAFVLRQETVWSEHLRIWPVVGIVVNAPGGHLHYVSWLQGQVSAG